ncbi:hypothetical protein AMATHDRAFT_68200 [Amanita thiersii Skay4041]|uniref:F-box domain-containing protein n=1 Tax=Amanita thiersii Skay4041 TaxID=703135 RepID=A0A2A9NHU5_9AGAR|nr:hypothetical protein AMATHDRAFT_68200 [Amanita thiersii Skay4041]
MGTFLESSKRSPLLALPSELLHEIFRCLTPRDLLRCCLVCRCFNLMINNSEFLYNIELGKHGMVDAGRISVPYVERLQAIKDRHQAWRSLEWKNVAKVDVAGPCTAYELVAGVFAKTSGRDLFLSWLPSSTSPGRVVHYQDIGMQLRDFVIDPTQNLIVMLDADDTPFQPNQPRNVWLHLRAMSSLENHPEARNPDLRFGINHPESGNHISSAFLQVANDVLAVFISMGFLTTRVIIWNWKDGRVINDSEEQLYGLPRACWDFALLSPRSFMITSIVMSGSILLYKFSYPDNPLPVHVATLHLPEIQDNRFVMFLASHSGPFLANAPENTVFTTKTDSRLHVISVGYRSANMPVANAQCFFFVHSSTFQRYIDLHERTQAAEPFNVPWEEWGSENSRFFVSPTPSQWLRYVQGQRVVSAPEFNDGRGLIKVWDFNVNRGDDPESSDFNNSQLVTSQSSVTALHMFKDRITTKLPYHSAFRVIDEDYGAFMIDEERVIGLKVDPSNREEIVGLHVYCF